LISASTFCTTTAFSVALLAEFTAFRSYCLISSWNAQPLVLHLPISLINHCFNVQTGENNHSINHICSARVFGALLHSTIAECTKSSTIFIREAYIALSSLKVSHNQVVIICSIFLFKKSTHSDNTLYCFVQASQALYNLDTSLA